MYLELFDGNLFYCKKCGMKYPYRLELKTNFGSVSDQSNNEGIDFDIDMDSLVTINHCNQKMLKLNFNKLDVVRNFINRGYDIGYYNDGMLLPEKTVIKPPEIVFTKYDLEYLLKEVTKYNNSHKIKIYNDFTTNDDYERTIKEYILYLLDEDLLPLQNHLIHYEYQNFNDFIRKLSEECPIIKNKEGD